MYRKWQNNAKKSAKKMLMENNMEAEDIIESILWASPFIVLAIIGYSMYFWKTIQGKKLLSKGTSLIDAGCLPQGVNVLKDALWKANEKPELERAIIQKLDRVYKQKNISFDSNNYLVLVTQYRTLSKKKSYIALEEIKKVQALKKQILDKMPNII
jgi:hypothetical protein